MKVSLAILLGIYRALVVPVQSEDCQPTLTQDDLKSSVTRASDYLSAQFKDVKEFTFDIASPVTLSNSISYYGRNGSDRKDSMISDAVAEVCASADGTVDFSQYDNDSDGIVDAVVVVFPGKSEALGESEDAIWPQASKIDDRYPLLYYDGCRVSGFVSVCEEQLVGTLCHELMHTFGLVDLYDADGAASGGVANGMWGSTSLMDNGGQNNGGLTPPNLNAVELDQLGFGTVDTLRAGHWNLKPGERRYIKVSSSSTPSDYYLLEARAETGWDEYIGGSGLLVYHIDKSDRYAGYSDFYRVTLTAYERWERNLVNCRPDRECADLVEADPAAREVSQVFFPQPGYSSLASESNPPFRFVDGTSPSLAIVGITKESDGSVSFDAIEPIKVTETYEFQTSAIVCWTADETLTVKDCVVTWSAEDSENAQTGVGTVSKRSDGVWACRIAGLEPRTGYRVTIHLLCEDGSSYSLIRFVRTKFLPAMTFPYIYLPTEGRNLDGTFHKGTVIPLQIYNASGVSEVKWYFGGLQVDASASFLTLRHGGELRAEVYYETGGRDVIIKLLTVNE